MRESMSDRVRTLSRPKVEGIEVRQAGAGGGRGVSERGRLPTASAACGTGADWAGRACLGRRRGLAKRERTKSFRARAWAGMATAPHRASLNASNGSLKASTTKPHAQAPHTSLPTAASATGGRTGGGLATAGRCR